MYTYVYHISIYIYIYDMISYTCVYIICLYVCMFVCLYAGGGPAAWCKHPQSHSTPLWNRFGAVFGCACRLRREIYIFHRIGWKGRIRQLWTPPKLQKTIFDLRAIYGHFAGTPVYPTPFSNLQMIIFHMIYIYICIYTYIYIYIYIHIYIYI